MKDLIEALTILLKYGDTYNPTHCEHDILYVFAGVKVSEMNAEDVKRLEELSFSPDEESGTGFYSYRFGSA